MPRSSQRATVRPGAAASRATGRSSRPSKSARASSGRAIASVGRVGARQEALDGEAALVVADPEAGARVGDEDERRDGPLVGDAQGVAAEDGAQAAGLAAGDRDHGGDLLGVGWRSSRAGRRAGPDGACRRGGGGSAATGAGRLDGGAASTAAAAA